MAKIDDEIAKVEKMLKKQPKDAALWLLLGRLHRNNNKFMPAINSFTQCVAIDRECYKAWLYIGFCFLDLFKLKEALETFSFVLQMQPREDEAVFGCAIVQESLGNHADALALLDHAIALAPDNAKLYPFRASLRATHGGDQALTLAGFRDWAQRFADPLTDAAAPLAVDRSPGRKLRIGYVSADLRDHSVAYFVEPIFARHDRQNFHVCVFASGSQDHVTARIRPTVDQWFDVSAMDDAQVHALIRRQKIDILLDLSGHTRGNRLLSFARRAAPVQATWMGYMYTTGMRAMDYRLTDAIVDPPGQTEASQSETLFRQRILAIYNPPADTPFAAQPPMLAKGRVTFVSLNNLKKVTNEMLGVWRRILEQVPDSILILIGSERTQEDAIAQQRGRLEAVGLPLERLCILPRMGMSGFMQMGTIADIALDTFPLSGGTTTVHSLWMGLPIVCMAGQQAFETSTANVMNRLGYGELVAGDADQYVATAVALARDPQRQAGFRAGVRARMQQSPLMDYDGFVHDMETALRLMWLNYLKDDKTYLHTGYAVQAEIRACESLPLAA
jgi:predicted O-linked N-acetylglucosamine transferase (SPINDLY family)